MRLSSIALLATLIAYGAAIPLHPRAGSGTTGTGTDYSKLDQYPGAPVKAGSTTGDDAVLIKASEEKLTAKTLELKRLDAKLSDKDHEGVWPQLQKQREKAVTAMNSILEVRFPLRCVIAGYTIFLVLMKYLELG